MIFNTDISSKQGGSFDLIWENLNQTSAFSPQTLNLPTGYSAYVIEFNFCPTNSIYLNTLVYVPFSDATRYFKPLATTYSNWQAKNVISTREIVSANNGAIVFGNARRYNADDALSGITDNTYSIPLAIYGLKFTL